MFVRAIVSACTFMRQSEMWPLIFMSSSDSRTSLLNWWRAPQRSGSMPVMPVVCTSSTCRAWSSRKCPRNVLMSPAAAAEWSTAARQVPALAGAAHLALRPGRVGDCGRTTWLATGCQGHRERAERHRWLPELGARRRHVRSCGWCRRWRVSSARIPSAPEHSHAYRLQESRWASALLER